MANKYGTLFEGWETAVAKNTVSQFLDKHSWLRGWEFEDLLQECLAHWLHKRSYYRQGRGASPKTYMAKVLRNKLTDIAREGLAEKRTADRIAESLDQPLNSEDEGMTLGGTVSDRNCGSCLPFESRIDLEVDLRRVLGRLTPRQQEICDLLLKKVCKTGVADQLGIHRSTLSQEIKRIRRVLQDNGLADYI